MKGSKRPYIVKIDRQDAHWNGRKNFVEKTAMGIKSVIIKENGFIGANLFISGRWILFYKVKLSYIPEKFLK